MDVSHEYSKIIGKKYQTLSFNEELQDYIPDGGEAVVSQVVRYGTNLATDFAIGEDGKEYGWLELGDETNE